MKHMSNQRRIFGIEWHHHIPSIEALGRTLIPNILSVLQQCRLRWLRHVHCMADDRIPKDILYAQLATGSRSQERPNFCFKDVCKSDLKQFDMDSKRWDELAKDRRLWRHELRRGLARGEVKFRRTAEDKRSRRKHSARPALRSSRYKCKRSGKNVTPASDFIVL